jgi:hypothetical protein
MGSRSATELLRLPVQLHGIRLGRPVDLLFAPAAWRVLGCVVLCGDDVERFLAFAAAEPAADEISVPSALLLLEDVDFYRARSRSLRAHLGGTVTRDGRALGILRDVLVTDGGLVSSLVVEREDGSDEVGAEGVSIQTERVSAA